MKHGNTLASGVLILKRAVKLDHKQQYTMALELYKKSLRIIFDNIKDMTLGNMVYCFSKMKQYVVRANKLEFFINRRKAAGTYRELIKIENGSTGHSYESVFGTFLDSTVQYMKIEDPYIRTVHQIQNLVRLCELAVQKCNALSKISLLTTYDSKKSDQISILTKLKKNLAFHNISFDFAFSETLHDRQITLSNGWVIKIGRGLDYFKRSKGNFILGSYDLEFRPCLETTVDIFHKNQFRVGAK